MEAVLSRAQFILGIGITACLQKHLHDIWIELAHSKNKKFSVLIDTKINLLGEFQNNLGHFVVFQVYCIGEGRIRVEVCQIGIGSILEEVVDHSPVVVDDGLMEIGSHFHVFTLTVDVVLFVEREPLRKLLECHILILLFN